MEPPTISNVPDDINRYRLVTAGSGGVEVTWTRPTEADNSGYVTLTSSHESPFNFPLGETIVSYTARDDAGNVAMASFAVTITGRTDFVLFCC